MPPIRDSLSVQKFHLAFTAGTDDNLLFLLIHPSKNCLKIFFLIHPKDARDCLPYPKYKIQLFLEIYIIQTTFCKGQLQLSAKQSIFLIFSNCSVFLLFSLLFLFYDDILKMYALYGVSLLFTKVISQIKEEQHQWN